MWKEVSNRISKNIVQRMGPNKSIDSIARVCKATNEIKTIIENFNVTYDINAHSVQHKSKESRKDEEDMIQDLKLLKPFTYSAWSFSQ